MNLPDLGKGLLLTHREKGGGKSHSGRGREEMGRKQASKVGGGPCAKKEPNDHDGTGGALGGRGET